MRPAAPGKPSTTPRFAAAFTEAEPGRIHPSPIATPYGWHALWLERRIDGRTLPLEAVEEKIKTFLDARIWQHAVKHDFGILVGRAEIGGISLDGAGSPLVQ